MSCEEDNALLIKEGVKQLFAPYHDLLAILLGPAFEEVGLSVGEQVSMWRAKRWFRFMAEFQRLIDVIGLDIQPTAMRKFFPILEAKSIEDDDNMQTRWAALLANEATSPNSVHPSYIDILRQLSPEDAKLLDTLYEEVGSQKYRTILDSEYDVNSLSFYNLTRLGLIETIYDLDSKRIKVTVPVPAARFDSRFPHNVEGNLVGDLDNHWWFSDFAVAFVQACRAPKAIEGTSKDVK
jgi:abortive infection alpha-like protein/uncharacterized protein DUF2806